MEFSSEIPVKRDCALGEALMIPRRKIIFFFKTAVLGTRKNRLRSIVMILSIAIGFSALVGVNLALQQVTAIHFSEFVNKTPADFVIMNQSPGKFVNQTFVEEELSYIENVFKASFFSGSYIQRLNSGSPTDRDFTVLNFTVTNSKRETFNITDPMLLGLDNSLLENFSYTVSGNIEGFKASDNQTIWITEAVASLYNLNIGDEVTYTIITSSTVGPLYFNGTWRIGGIFTLDPQLIVGFDYSEHVNTFILPIQYMRTFFNASADAVTHIMLRVDRSIFSPQNPSYSYKLARAIYLGLDSRLGAFSDPERRVFINDYLTINIKAYAQWLSFQQISLTLFSLFPLILSAYLMMTSATMSVRQRSRDFSVWLARGFKLSDLFRVVFIESIFFEVVGITLGFFLSPLLAGFFRWLLPNIFGGIVQNRNPLQFFEITSIFKLSVQLILLLTFLTFFITLIPTLYPLYKFYTETENITEGFKYIEVGEAEREGLVKWATRTTGFIIIGIILLSINFNPQVTLPFEWAVITLILGATLIYFGIYRIISWKIDWLMIISRPLFSIVLKGKAILAYRFISSRRQTLVRIMFLVGLSISLITVAMLQETAQRDLLRSITEYQVGAEYVVQFTAPISPYSLTDFQTIDIVQNVVYHETVTLKLGGTNFILNGLTLASALTVMYLKSYYLKPNIDVLSQIQSQNASILITKYVSDLYLLNIGSNITLSTGFELLELKVNGIITAFPGINIEKTASGITDISTLRYFNLTTELRNIFFKAAPNIKFSELQEKIRDYMTSKQIYNYHIISLADEVQKAFKQDSYLAISSFLSVLSNLIILQVVIAIILLGLQSVQERERTLGVLRARGFASKETVSFIVIMFSYPLLLSVIFGIIFGLALSLLLNTLRVSAFSFIRPTLSIPLHFYPLIIGISVLYELSILVPASQLSRKKITENLLIQE